MRDIFKKKATADSTVLVDSQGLLQWVQTGDIAALRGYFDQSLTGTVIVEPTWRHLLAALNKGDMPMMRLLITWGARPNKTVWQDLTTHDVQRLRVAGVDPRDLPERDTIAPHPDQVLADQIPAEWKALLNALHQNGSPEAVIAGGALRDLAHGKPIKDVDIFLAQPTFKWQEKLIRKAFKDAGQPLKQETRIYCDIDDHVVDMSIITALKKTSMYSQKTIFGMTTAWVAQTKDTEYNIVFMKGDLADHLRSGAKYGGMTATTTVEALIDRFDVGLCQIAFNGREVISSHQYHMDRIHKTLTLTRPDETSFNHLKRITEKYPDFTPDARIKAILQPPILQPPPVKSQRAFYYKTIYGRGRIIS